MKKVISSLLVAAMALCTNNVKADNISLSEARSAAAYFMGYYNGTNDLSEDDLTLVYQIQNEKMRIPAAYIFNTGDEGWVMMAGTTTIDPIIGYSAEGSIVMSELPENLVWWLQGYTEMISEIQELDAENDYPDHEVWASLKNKTYKGSTKDAQHILIQTRWDQGDKTNPTYNMYCPTDTSGRYHAVTGCVATAMAQIIRYFEYPRQAKGTAFYSLRPQFANGDPNKYLMPAITLRVNFDTMTPFDYSLMPNGPTNLSGNVICSAAEMREVARLSYYTGVTVKMAYAPDGSGTQSSLVPAAMNNYFKYKMGTLVARRSTTDRDFVNGIRSMLLDGNVVYMSGASSIGDGADAAGHAWVCGGYMQDDTNSYYMNWGWGGAGNGFFKLGANNMYIRSMHYNFNERLNYIKNMVPDGTESIAEAMDATELGSPYPSPAVHSVVLPYDAPVASDLIIYNIEGKVVATYHVQPGRGELTVNVEGMPSGMYIYRMNSRSGRFIVK